MAQLIYTALASLDGYIEDKEGNFEFAMPSLEVHGAANRLAARVGTQILGRKMYETLKVWDVFETEGEPPEIAEYKALWLDSDKIVVSRTLTSVDTERTALQTGFDADEVARLKAASDRDIGIGGPELAGQAIAAGIVDEIHLFLSPVLVGAGKPAVPVDALLELELTSLTRFDDGFVYLRYEPSYSE